MIKVFFMVLIILASVMVTIKAINYMTSDSSAQMIFPTST